MINIFDKTITFLARPKILHSLPGRLRLHLPLLKKIQNENAEWDTMISQYLEQPQGIESASVNLITGNVLFNYDPELLSERDIIQFVDSIISVLMSRRKDISRLEQDDPVEIRKQISLWLDGV